MPYEPIEEYCVIAIAETLKDEYSSPCNIDRCNRRCCITCAHMIRGDKMPKNHKLIGGEWMIHGPNDNFCGDQEIVTEMSIEYKSCTFEDMAGNLYNFMCSHETQCRLEES